MRFVAVKTQEQQARSMVFRIRDLLVRQRTQLINALRGHLAEHGVISPQGPVHLKVLAAAIDDAHCSLPPLVRDIGKIYLQRLRCCTRRSLIWKRSCAVRLSVDLIHAASRQCLGSVR